MTCQLASVVIWDLIAAGAMGGVICYMLMVNLIKLAGKLARGGQIVPLGCDGGRAQRRECRRPGAEIGGKTRAGLPPGRANLGMRGLAAGAQVALLRSDSMEFFPTCTR
jgi:hypothetical protein